MADLSPQPADPPRGGPVTPAEVAAWARAHPLTPLHVDCATAVMLKILDGKCKMKDAEKRVMALLYDAVKSGPGERLDPAVHDLIALARQEPDEALLLRVYEQRLLAETALSRPVMKGFKALIRQQGLLDGADEAEGDEA